MVGSGIFITTGMIYSQLDNPWLVLLVWLLGGIFSIAGALTYAQLAIYFPQAGGDYIYLKEAYSPLVAFISGWSSLLITFSASISVLGLALGEYLSFLFPYESGHTFWKDSWFGVEVKLGYPGLVGIGFLFLFTFVNYFGIRKASWIQNVLTIAKVAGLLVFSVLAIGNHLDGFSQFPPLGELFSLGGISHSANSTAANATTRSGWGFGILLALVPVIFSYLGWNTITYIAEEVVEPEKNIAKVVFGGTLLVTGLYVLVNLGFLFVLRADQLMDNTMPGVDAAGAVFGWKSQLGFSIFFCLALLGSLSAMVIGGSRIYFAMARDGLFFPFLSKLHPHYKSPYNSLVFQALYASLFMVLDLQFLLYTITCAILFLSALTAYSIFIFRRQGYACSYKIPFYPITPWFYILGCVLLIARLGYENPSQAVFGLGILGSAVPVYFLFRRKFRNQ